jgi:hypothetical protein
MDLDLERQKIDFSIEKSIRYHHRRLAHYDKLHKFMMLAVIITGSAAFGELLGEHSARLGLLTAALAAFDLIMALPIKARDHQFLHARFSDLAPELRSCTAFTQEHLANCQKKRIEIEKDEPPIFWGLRNHATTKCCKHEVLRISLIKRP